MSDNERKRTINDDHNSALPQAKLHQRPIEPHPKGRPELAKAGKNSHAWRSSLNEERTTMFALRALIMLMFPMALVIMVILVLPMLMMVFPVVERRLLQRPSKRSTEETSNLQRLGLDVIVEPVASPSARTVMLDSPGSS